MVDVLLIQPPFRDFYLTRKRTLPYGLACIAAGLRARGLTVEILDALACGRSRPLALPEEMAHLEEHYGRADCSPFALFHGFQHHGLSFAAVAERAAASGAWLVGVSSLFSAYSGEAELAARAVKERRPDCALVVGGHHPTALPEAALGSGTFDFAIRGEGELALPALALALRGGGQLDCVPGLVWRDGGRLRQNPPAVIADLDAAPLPATDLVARRAYRRGGRGGAVIMTSRGCPLRCSYCSVGAASPLPYRRRGLASVLAELERELREHDAGFVDFEDENLSLERDWFEELLRQVERRCGDRLELRAMNGLLPHTLDEPLLRSMRAAGFRTLNLSLGSACAEQSRRFCRPDQRRALDRALHAAEELGLETVTYLIAAAPGQRARDSLADLLHLAGRRTLIGLSIYYPAPGSPDWAACQAAGLLPPRLSLLRSSALPIADLTSRLEAATLLRLARLLNFGKALLDGGGSLPDPAPLPLPLPPAPAPADRRAVGRTLLAAFLHDGALRGVTPEGEVYQHAASAELCLEARDWLRTQPLRGTR